MSSASEQPPVPAVPAHVRAPVPPGFESLEQWRAHQEAERRRAEDAGVLAGTILACCGVGTVLEVGCGDGALLRALSSRGCGVRGVDASVDAVDMARRACPRVDVGDVRSLDAYGAGADTVVAVDVLHFLEEHEVAGAIGAMARAARRSVFLRVSTLPAEERPKHRVSRPREWWQQKCLEAGLRTHPRAMVAAAYEHLDAQRESVTLALEKLPEAGLGWPLSRLADAKQLHMDMLREPGRRADAHVARYMLAAGLVRPGDTVLDAACGLGYGAHVIAQNSRAARVVGVDVDGGCVAYAGEMYGEAGRVEFRHGDAQDLSHVADGSVDLVVSFETLEHLADPRRALREFARVLTPGGRLIASVPNDWTDGTGKDPNPHHMHVYTWDALAEQVRAVGLLFERAQAQTAGGGMKHTHAARAVRDVKISEAGFVQEEGVPAEWWLVTAMKDPLGAGNKAAYCETVFPVKAEFTGNVAAFARDYDNPWLVRSMVSIGQRATGDLLFSIAARAAKECRAGSPDMGAALCVLGYHGLEQPGCSPEWIAEMRERVRGFDEVADRSPHAQRWRCSCWFVVGRLLMAVGDREGAREAFEKCVGIDVLVFSPLLATKTVEARWWLGVLAAGERDLPRARAHWRSGFEEAQRAAAADGREVIGDPDRPFAFGLPELSQALDQGARCAWAVGMGDAWLREPGLAWGASAVTMASARQELAREAARMREAWRGQQDAIAALVGVRDSLWEESRRAGADLAAAQRDAEQARAEQRAAVAEHARSAEADRAERDGLFAEVQRLAGLWERLREHNAALQGELDRQSEARAAAELERDTNWAESQRLAGLWEALRAEQSRLMHEGATLRERVAASEERADGLQRSLDIAGAERDRLARELEALRVRTGEVEGALRSVRAALDAYRAGLRYRVLRAARVVHEVPGVGPGVGPGSRGASTA